MSFGTFSSVSDLLNNRGSGEIIESTHSLNTIAGTSSGPVDRGGFKDFSTDTFLNNYSWHVVNLYIVV